MAHINQPGPKTGGDETHVEPGGEVHGHGVRAASAAVTTKSPTSRSPG